ncbi:MAG: hypothetical protein ABR558_06125 [Thioalkalivibrio sp.]
MTILMNKALTGPQSAPTESGTETVDMALRNGAFGTARLRFLRLSEGAQLRLLEEIPVKDAVRLSGGLPTYTLTRLYERLPRKLGRALMQSLPDGKRHGVLVILNHRRRA